MHNPVKTLPDYVNRDAVIRFLRDLGLEPGEIRSFKLKTHGIEVAIIHFEDEGTRRRLVDAFGEPVISRVFIPIRSEDGSRWGGPGERTDQRTTKVRQYLRDDIPLTAHKIDVD